ncbi:hypothetical protein PLICRDRAFT_504934 [Plicaturopsis crispa FD-325 SS-3]|nr:hypothetical protein PLICRDRAFT_504934 [Plicaturopsis crispa FD-325 SS-3]
MGIYHGGYRRGLGSRHARECAWTVLAVQSRRRANGEAGSRRPYHWCASSMAGTKGFKGLGAYCVSKWAIRGLTQSVAADLIPHKITVNAYAPGFIKSKMSISEADAGRGPGAAAKLAMGFPADGPIGELEDIASIVSYLAKPEAYFITGQTILVDGGIL